MRIRFWRINCPFIVAMMTAFQDNCKLLALENLWTSCKSSILRTEIKNCALMLPWLDVAGAGHPRRYSSDATADVCSSNIVAKYAKILAVVMKNSSRSNYRSSPSRWIRSPWPWRRSLRLGRLGHDDGNLNSRSPAGPAVTLSLTAESKTWSELLSGVIVTRV